MLKGISSVISPDLLKILMEMGHGDELVLADGNFPSASHAKRLIRLDGHGTLNVLEAILPLFPLDTYVECPIALMQVVEGDPVTPTLWEQYKSTIGSEPGASVGFEFFERYEFYERSKKAYAIVATGEKEQYANLILKKGVI